MNQLELALRSLCTLFTTQPQASLDSHLSLYISQVEDSIMASVNGESSTLPVKQRGAVEEIISKRLKTLTKKIVRLPIVKS
jgi:hypothetical protein